jgi:RNA-directed DNA polymerase
MNQARYKWNFWHNIYWKEIEIQVFKLQKRIYKASLRGDYKAVHRLQRLLTSSYYGKLLAVRRVTQDNKGKKTAGVDGKKALTGKQRIKLVDSLNLKSKAKPLRRVWIAKPDGTQRGLGIPIIRDRATQALVKLAMEPEWEAKFEPNSYGFRPGRSCHDAIAAIFQAINQKAKYVLDADISNCFDKINHTKLLEKINTYPTLRKIIKQWLKAGVIDNNVFSETEAGTPQGGVFSPLLANIALHGMEEKIKEFASTWKGKKDHNKKSISLIRYADDLVILHKDLNRVLEAKEVIEQWLKEIGLELKPSKTRITHTLNRYEGNMGFDFLGFTVRQFPLGKNQTGKSSNKKKLEFKTIIKPSQEKVLTHLHKVKEVIKQHRNAPQSALVSRLNSVIRGWTNFYSTVCSKVSFKLCWSKTFRKLEKWGYKRHSQKSKTWVNNKYWHKVDGDKWTFGYREKGNLKTLMKHDERKIVRHTKVKGTRSPYDGDWLYWSTRMGKYCGIDSFTATLMKKQKGKCKHCGLHFKDDDLIEDDHIIPKSKGGSDKLDNRQLLHRHCHDVKTAKDGSNSRKKA